MAYGPSTTSQHSSGPHANLCTYLSVSVGPPPTKSGNPSEHLGHPPLDVTSPIDATHPLLSLTCKRAPIRGRHLGLSVVSRNWIKSYFPPTSSRGHVHWSVPNLVRKHMLVHVPLRGPRQARPGMYHLRLLGVLCAARCGLVAAFGCGEQASRQRAMQLLSRLVTVSECVRECASECVTE